MAAFKVLKEGCHGKGTGCISFFLCQGTNQDQWTGVKGWEWEEILAQEVNLTSTR